MIKERECKWIEKHCSLDGSYVEQSPDGGGLSIYLKQNNIQLFVSKKQLLILKDLLNHFCKKLKLEGGER